jgi:enterochelin esterase-like enzyme
VVTLEGGHDWTTWRVLWSKLLDRIALNAGFDASR